MIEVSAAQIDRAENMLKHIPKSAPKALARAINRAANSARTEAGRKARETYHINHKDVISTIRIDRATSMSLAAKVTSRGNTVSLAKFRVTPKQPAPKRKIPISVRVKRGEGGPVKRAFVARVQNGHLGVFERAGKRRLPFQELYGPPVPVMLGSPTVRAWVEEKAAETLDRRLEHEIGRILEGNG